MMPVCLPFAKSLLNLSRDAAMERGLPFVVLYGGPIWQDTSHGNRPYPIWPSSCWWLVPGTFDEDTSFDGSP
jgi:hypothetical protein